MIDEQRFIEKLQRIEALFVGAAMPGERDAAAQTRDRIRGRLREQQQTNPPVEFAFKRRDRWSHKLLIALLRRYQIRPYRYRGQRYTTIMARVPQRFVNEVLWPEFEELNRNWLMSRGPWSLLPKTRAICSPLRSWEFKS